MGEDKSNETEKSLLLNGKFDLNKSYANIKYFRKIIEDNQESIILSLTFFLHENIKGNGNYGYRDLPLTFKRIFLNSFIR